MGNETSYDDFILYELKIWGRFAPQPPERGTPRREFLIFRAHRLLKREAQLVVAYAKNSPRRARRSGGLGDEIPHIKYPSYKANKKTK